MAEHQIGAVLVGERGDIVGIVTDRDLALAVIAEGVEPRDTPLSSVMHQPVASIDAEADIDEAIALMQANGCRRLPVLADGRLVGIVTFDDLLMSGILDPQASAGVVRAELELAAATKEWNRPRVDPPQAASVLGRRLHALRRHQARATATYHRLVHDVQQATGLKTRDAAETTLLIVLDGICRRLPRAQADHLLAQLSSIAHEELEPLAETPDKEITALVIESELKAELDLSDELARVMVRTVFAVVAQHVSSGQAANLRRSMPADLRELFPEP
jgi:uncharacterized protein (DUF2267 family)